MLTSLKHLLIRHHIQLMTNLIGMSTFFCRNFMSTFLHRCQYFCQQFFLNKNFRDMEREDEIRQELYESMELGPDSRRSMSPTSRRRLNNVAIEPFGLGESPIDLPIFQKRRKHSSQNLLNRALVLEGNDDEENSNSIYFFCRDMCPNIRSVQKLVTNVKNGDKSGAISSCDKSQKSGKYLVVFNQSEDRNNFMKKCKTSKYNIQPFQNDHQE